ncbi:hypothetical protein SteCoe_12412 [Stentor coeruleus]|uniref:RING-type domain-containing protein n=1 Tax=Stentor coeruleus TaxID=5963 RepID=A0A1R2CAV7_9CILI|nr:hypothetical protein SteCoe_12412 [Stentor coeruleus]
MDGLRCTNCEKHFDCNELIPLVLPCGDSICMICILRYSNQSKRYQCLICWRAYELNNIFIKDLPKNNALLSLIGREQAMVINQRPQPKALFSTPENKRLFNPSFNSVHYYTPSTEPSLDFKSIYMTSPNSASLKCMRFGCSNDRYVLDGKLLDYCCQDCYDKSLIPRSINFS